MLDLKLIRNQPEEIAENCRKRNVQVDIEKLLMLDKQVRHITTEADVIRQRRNDINKRMKGKITSEVRKPLIEESKILREEESAKESKLRELIEQRLDLHKQAWTICVVRSHRTIDGDQRQSSNSRRGRRLPIWLCGRVIRGLQKVVEITR